MDRHVLLIDEDETAAECVRKAFQRSGDHLYHVRKAQDAITQMITHSIDIVALSVFAPGADSILPILLELRQDANRTLLLLYPVSNTKSRAAYLESGADMCLPECSAEECAAAIGALLRMPACADRDTPPLTCILFKDLMIDPLRKKVIMDGTSVELTRAEFKILYYLACNQGIVLSKEIIYERLWQTDVDCGCDNIAKYIYSLRHKLGLPADDKVYIRTLKGVGYCFAP